MMIRSPFVNTRSERVTPKQAQLVAGLRACVSTLPPPPRRPRRQKFPRGHQPPEPPALVPTPPLAYIATSVLHKLHMIEPPHGGNIRLVSLIDAKYLTEEMFSIVVELTSQGRI